MLDKNGKDIPLNEVLEYLTGTDDVDYPSSVMDFSMYNINEDKTVGDPTYYLVAVDAIVTQISFMGPFTMVEVDFRNMSSDIMKQVIGTINKFHSAINTEQVMLVSTITSLKENAPHILNLFNPLVCVRGYSEEGQGSTLIQLIYSSDNVLFSHNNIDVEAINAEVDRELYEMEAAIVSQEIQEAAAYEETDNENNDMMKDMFHPEFTPDFGGVTTSEERMKDKDSVRISGTRNREQDKTVRVGGNNSTRITGNEDEEEI